MENKIKAKKCPKCKKVYPYSAYDKCPECKVLMRNIEIEKEKEEETYLGLRIIAYLIDVWGLLILYAIITYPIFHDDIPLFVALPSGLIILVIYPLFKDGIFKGQSIGKKVVKLMVIDNETRKPCSYWQSFKRNIVLFIPFVILIEFITLTEKKRRWGDKVGKTEVIKKNEN